VKREKKKGEKEREKLKQLLRKRESVMAEPIFFTPITPFTF
jgi:hypothetical protein